MTEFATPTPPTPTAAEHQARDQDAVPLPQSLDDPFGLFAEWFKDAEAHEINDANAAQLATTGLDGRPDVRTILLKEMGPDGFVFYSHTTSPKAQDIAENPNVALQLHWKSLRRQVRLRGRAERVSDAQADAYFAKRARDSQLGAWASQQSAVLDNPSDLDHALEEMRQRFADQDVPRPEHWSGWRIQPVEIEFWQERGFRLHERLLCMREAVGSPWQSMRLFP